MQTDKRKLILNAFKPSRSIRNPANFAGREIEILELIDALLTDGSCPVIYGERGLGKSSLAIQVARIALGDQALLESLGHTERALGKGNQFIPIWFTCTDEVKNKNDLIESAMNSSEIYSNLVNLNKFQNDDIDGQEISSSKFQFEATKISKNIYGKDFNDLKPEDKFILFIKIINEYFEKPILFIIDEFDRMKSKAEFSSFIKKFSSDNFKFLLVGIANNISSLLYDHRSLDRTIYGTYIEEMVAGDLKDIVHKALNLLKNNGINISISDEAISYLVEKSNGFPWFVHVIGQEALRVMHDNKKWSLTTSDIQWSIKNLANNRFSQNFSDLYTTAVRDSRNREIVLRLFAKWSNKDIPTQDIARMAKVCKVSNPSTCKRDLMQHNYGATISSPEGMANNIVRFDNAMFKTYINLRQSIYQNVDAEVDNISKAYFNSQSFSQS